MMMKMPQLVSNCSTDLDWKFISSVKKHVEENMDNGALNVEMLCSLLNMSRTSFYNKIKALTDQAPGRLYPIDTSETCRTITERAEIQHN